MKYILFCVILLSTSVNVVYGQINSPQELADNYKKFYDRKDIDKIVTLFYSKEAVPLSVSSITDLFKYDFETNVKIEKVIVSKIDQVELEKMTNGYPYKGKLLVPTINNLTHTMKVFHLSADPNTTELSTEIHIGKTEAGYLFTMTKLIEQNQ